MKKFVENSVDNDLKKMSKSENGITMLALVFTMIILLIIAGVAVPRLTGEQGLLSETKNAKAESDRNDLIKSIQEEIFAAKALKKRDMSESEINEIIAKYDKDGSIKTGDNDYEYIVTKEGYEISVLDIYGSADAITIANNARKYYGKYVTNYDCDYNEGIADAEGQLDKWQIFYSDGNNIYLIASNYIDYDHCPNSMNQSIYKNDNNYSLSINNVINDYTGSVDISDTSNITDMTKKKIKEKIKALNSKYFKYLEDNSTTSENYNMKAVAYMLDPDVWSVYKDKNNKAEYAIGGPTTEILFKSYNQKYYNGNETYQTMVDGVVGYKKSMDGGINWRNNNHSDEVFSITDKTYVIEDSTNAEALWIASPTNQNNVNMVDAIYYTGWFTNSSYWALKCGFRPMVCLKPGVELEKQADGTFKIK